MKRTVLYIETRGDLAVHEAETERRLDELRAEHRASVGVETVALSTVLMGVNDVRYSSVVIAQVHSRDDG